MHCMYYILSICVQSNVPVAVDASCRSIFLPKLDFKFVAEVSSGDRK